MPISDALNQQYEDKLKTIGNNFQGLNSQQIQAAIGSGGSLSGSLGYSDPREVMGLTPDQFSQMLANRTNLMNENLKQVTGAVDLRDQLYGISKNREAQMQAARDEYSAGKQSELSAAQQKAEMDRTIYSQTQENQRSADTLAIHKAQLFLQAKEHADNMAHNNATLAEMKREHDIMASQNSEQKKIEWANVGLKSKEIDLLNQNRQATLMQHQQQYNQNELNQTNNYIAKLTANKAKKGGDSFENDSALFYAQLKSMAMSGVSGQNSLLPVPTETHISSHLPFGMGTPNRSLMPGIDSVIIAPTDDPKGRYKQGDVLGVKADKTVVPVMPNPARHQDSMQVILNKMPGYRMTPYTPSGE